MSLPTLSTNFRGYIIRQVFKYKSKSIKRAWDTVALLYPNQSAQDYLRNQL
jgi:hypothetical protein